MFDDWCSCSWNCWVAPLSPCCIVSNRRFPACLFLLLGTHLAGLVFIHVVCCCSRTVSLLLHACIGTVHSICPATTEWWGVWENEEIGLWVSGWWLVSWQLCWNFNLLVMLLQNGVGRKLQRYLFLKYLWSVNYVSQQCSQWVYDVSIIVDTGYWLVGAVCVSSGQIFTHD